MALSKGIWDPKPKVTNVRSTNLKSLMLSPNNLQVMFLLLSSTSSVGPTQVLGARGPIGEATDGLPNLPEGLRF